MARILFFGWTPAAGGTDAAHSALPSEGWNQKKRPEEVIDTIHNHIWDAVNDHLGTSVHSFPELVEQLVVMRSGHRPRVADTFCGSGQLPFEAERLGCDVYASDLDPMACMLTSGAFHIVGGSLEKRAKMEKHRCRLVRRYGPKSTSSHWNRIESIEGESLPLLCRSSLPANRLRWCR